MRITDTWLQDAISPQKRLQNQYRKTVDRGPARKGLMVTVFPNGTAGFVMRYTRPSGERVFMPLGNYGRAGLSLAEACKAHDAALSLLEKGLDPKDERERSQKATEEARRERAGADTVASLVEQFVHRKLRAERWDTEARQWVRESRGNIKARKRPDAAAALLGYVEAPTAATNRRGKRKPVATLISELGHLKARDVTRRQLIQLLDAIVERGAPVTANRVHALLMQLFTWATAKDLIAASPMVGVERPGGEERPRQRVLSANEVKTFWEKLATADMAEPTRLALKLLLVTAQRRGELTFAKWSHFDLNGKTGKVWTIPVELLKTSHARRAEPEPHIVPLSPLALELLRKLHELTGESPYLLPAHASKKRQRPYSGGVLTRAVLQNKGHFGFGERFTPHDLRRTAASFMTKLKIPRLHVEKILNHSTGDIAEVYDRHDYAPEKRKALDKWGKHLSEILEGGSKPARKASRG